MTATPDVDMPLIDVIHAHACDLMTQVAATPNRYPTRQRRRELLAETDAELDNWLRLHRCEAKA